AAPIANLQFVPEIQIHRLLGSPRVELSEGAYKTFAFRMIEALRPEITKLTERFVGRSTES
ncbi:hypothetical protein, partial [Rhizobium sp. B209b/85]|uniref:hypothetical protein n=1 Tax=Rhizobium sp. B209b/85 TaxID=2819992 RepID=UPI001FFDF44A